MSGFAHRRVSHQVGKNRVDPVRPFDRVAFVGHEIHPLNMPMPLTYAAGTLVGVLGLGWARSFLHYDDEGDAAAQPAVR